ncbi:MAG: glycoside hydrolase family 2 TIM barrel-domain containing protein, partial [Bacteroidota bacterium]
FTSLNGKWQIVIDPFDAGAGNWKPIWKDQTPVGKTDFYEYKFDDAVTLNVPGDWNSQSPELKYYEGTIWYKKKFHYTKQNDKKAFLYFAAATYESDIFINGQKAGSHEGGFTPFQFDVTDKIITGDNSVIVRVSNRRSPESIPAMNFDWWNYGGITRDVYLLETPSSFIRDYFIQLAKGSNTEIKGWVQLAGENVSKKISVNIPELKINYNSEINEAGKYPVKFSTKPVLWSPQNPKLYDVIIKTDADSVHEMIGFRNISVKGTDIILNGNPVFLRGINIHEEIPQRAGRAWSEADAQYLLSQAKELGCNFVRLTHYPHNEHMVRLADKMGIMLWEEIPLWQGIQFSNPAILKKANTLLDEMIDRDKNRCAIILWSLSNETSPSESRNQTLTDMAAHARSLDSTRLITSAFNHVTYNKNTITIDDPLSKELDVLAVNEYIGWYVPWPAKPEEMEWKSLFNKPLIMSEFGGEALYGNHGPADTLSSWSEESQEQIFKDQVAMFKKIPFLKGTTPWILADFRSPNRRHPVYQEGWNRKGLLGNNGLRKKAWYIIRNYYQEMNDK